MEITNCTTNSNEIQYAVQSFCLSGTYCLTKNCSTARYNQSVEGKILEYYQFCPTGSVCSTPLERKSCPKHYYCAVATVKPRLCTFPTLTCRDSGLGAPVNYLSVSGVIAVGLLIVIFFVFVYALIRGCNLITKMRKKSLINQSQQRFEEPTSFSIKSLADECTDVIETLQRESFQAPPNVNGNGWDRVSNAIVSGTMKQSKNSWLNLGTQAKHKRHYFDQQEMNRTTTVDDMETSSFSAARTESTGDMESPNGNFKSSKNNVFHFKKVRMPLRIQFKDLSMHLIGSKTAPILSDINGGIRAKRITGLMGPSGSGKTSLLALLRGQTYYATTGGSIIVNNRIYRDLMSFKDVTSYVPQDDIMYDDLTVEENLKFAAVLFNKRGYTTITEVMPMVNHTMELLSMTHIRHSIVGSPERKGISGGQKKRVSIGMEMMKEASLFLLDEPTSGLDSASSISLLNALHGLTKLGVTIVATVHQPRLEILDLIDDLILLAPGGRLVYYGPTSEVATYFSQHLQYTMPNGLNIADYVMDVMAGFIEKDYISERQTVTEILDEICTHWKYEGCQDMGQLSPRGRAFVLVDAAAGERSHYYDTLKMDSTCMSILKHSITFLKILYIVLYRQISLFIRLITTFQMDSIALYVIGIIVALTYPTMVLQQYTSTFDPQISAMQLTFAQLVAEPGLRLFSQDALMRNRESESGIQLLPYFIGKYLGSLIEVVLFPAVFLLAYFSLAVPTASFLDYYLMLVIMQLVVYGFTNTISMIIPPRNRTLITNGILVMFWLFGGLVATQDTARMGIIFPIMKFISPFRFTFRMNVFMEYRTYSPVFLEKVLLPRLPRLQYGKYATAEAFHQVVDHLILDDIINLIIYGIVANTLAFVYLIYSKDHFKFYRTMKLKVYQYLHSLISSSSSSHEQEKIYRVNTSYDSDYVSSGASSPDERMSDTRVSYSMTYDNTRENSFVHGMPPYTMNR